MLVTRSDQPTTATTTFTVGDDDGEQNDGEHDQANTNPRGLANAPIGNHDVS